MKLSQFRKLIREEVRRVVREVKSQYKVEVFWFEEPAKDVTFKKLFGEFLTASRKTKQTKGGLYGGLYDAILDLDRLINKLETDKRYSVRQEDTAISIYSGDAGIHVRGLPEEVLTTLKKYEKSKPSKNLTRLKKMKASVGWVMMDGANYDVPDQDSWQDLLDNDSVVRTVSFEEGSKEVLKYAKDGGASAKDLSQMVAKLNQLKTKGNTFVLYGFEDDWNLGVL